MKTLKLPLLLSMCLLLISWSSEGKMEQHQHPVVFESSDTCHVCGMVITRFGGPKGQAFEPSDKQARKFCSTMEMVAWYLRADNKSNITEMFVHDLSKTTWNKPDDKHLISVKDAFFVIGSDKNGPMGPTLASFSSSSDAKMFAKEHGGKVKTFENLISAH